MSLDSQSHPYLGTGNATTGNGILSLPQSGDTAWQHVSRATAALPATTGAAIFTIATGRVLLMNIVGEVTTVIQTQADATKLVHNPTDTGTSTDLCGTLDITADAVGTMYSITGTLADALTEGLNLSLMQVKPIVLKPGAIELNCAATNTGSIKWDMWYIPLEAGAKVTAA